MAAFSSFWIDGESYGDDLEALLYEIGHSGFVVVQDHYSFL